jgi:predicted RNase H-like nuclease (RuvC/YqgF family)
VCSSDLPEQILALLPQSPHEWPVAQALRQEIIDFVESRISEMASSSNMDGLQESVNALQSQVEAIPDIRSELAKAPSLAAMQKIQAQLDELTTRVQGQDETIALLRQTLADKDAAIEALSAEAKALREELAAQASGAPAASDALKDELRQYVQQQAPLAAAKIVRQEIKALLKELGG